MRARVAKKASKRYSAGKRREAAEVSRARNNVVVSHLAAGGVDARRSPDGKMVPRIVCEDEERRLGRAHRLAHAGEASEFVGAAGEEGSERYRAMCGHGLGGRYEWRL